MSETYKIWRIPKRRKGEWRTIESPCDELKEKQRKLLPKLQEHLRVSPVAYAFQPYKSIELMASSHVGQEYVGSIDVADFFPGIKLDKFLEVTNPPEEVRKDLKLCFHDFDDGKVVRLPQGAPTSPLLSNVFLFRFDWRMMWSAHEKGLNYSRYADDLVFSGPKRDDIVAMIGMATSILKVKYDLKINKKKTKIVHRSRRQLCVGIVVNEKLNTKREDRKNLRAEIHQQKLKGNNLKLETLGRIAFHEMVRNSDKTTHSSREIIDSVKVTKEMKAVQ